MNHKVIPNLRYREYSTRDVVRVAIPKQYKLYIKHGAFPVDIYTVADEKTGEDSLIMIFMKSETEELWQKWMNHELD